MFELIFLLFIILYIFNLVWVSLKYSFTVFSIHPINIFSLYLAVFFILPQFFGSYYILPGFEYLAEDLNGRLDFVLLLVLIAYFVVTCVNIITYVPNYRKKTKTSKHKYGLVLEAFISIYLLFIIGILVFLILTSEGSIFNNIAEFTIRLRNGNAFLLMIIYTVEVMPIMYLLLSKNVSKIFLILIIIISMIIVIAVGARTLILSIVLGGVVIGLSYNKINIKKLLLIGLMFSVFFVSGSLVRNSGEDASYSSIDEKIENLKTYFSNNSDQLFTSLYVVDSIKKGYLEYQYGGTLVDAVYFFIPTAIWPEKPRSYYPSRLAFPDTIEKGVESNTKQTINFGMIARPFLDFGIVGILIINAFTAFFLTKVFYKIIFLREELSDKTVIICIYIYSHIHQVYILGSWSHMVSIIIFNFIFINLILFMFKVFRFLFK